MSSPYTPTVQTFTLTNGNTAQLLVAANGARQNIMINPVTESSLIQFGATAGTQATGTLTASDQPTASETIAVNGITLTFVAGASTSTNVHIGATKEDTMANLAAVLNASANAALTVATYSVSDAVVTITYTAGGTDGNAYTLANSSGTAVVTRSAATLAGGSSTVGGWTMAAGVPVIIPGDRFPSIKNDIYIVSASNGAATNYLEGL